jgi:RNA polymerase sigma-B factor
LACVEDAQALESWLAPLSERERVVMRLRFCDELRQREIGELLGISQMHVSRLIHKSLLVLRDTARIGTN